MVEVSPDCIMRRSAYSWRRGSSRLPSFRSQSSSAIDPCPRHSATSPSRLSGHCSVFAHRSVIIQAVTPWWGGQSSARCRRAKVYRFPYSLRPLPELGALSGVDAVVSDSLRGDESTSSSATRVPKHVENRSQTFGSATGRRPRSLLHSTRRSWMIRRAFTHLRVCHHVTQLAHCPELWSRFLGLSYALPSAEQWSTAR